MAAVARAPRSFFQRPRPVPVKPRPLRLEIERLEREAYECGVRMGNGNIHYTPKLNYITGREWRAWLRGWRQGQRQLKARLAIERAELEALS